MVSEDWEPRPTAGEIAWAEEHEPEKAKELKKKEAESVSGYASPEVTKRYMEREYGEEGKEIAEEVTRGRGKPKKKKKKKPKKKPKKVTKYYASTSGKVHKTKVPPGQQSAAGSTLYTSKEKAEKEAEEMVETYIPYEQKSASIQRKKAEQQEKAIKQRILEVKKAPKETKYEIEVEKKGKTKKKTISKQEALKRLEKQWQETREFQIQAGSYISGLEETKQKFKEMKQKGYKYKGVKEGEYQFEKKGKGPKIKKEKEKPPATYPTPEQKRWWEKQKMLRTMREPESPWGRAISPAEKIVLAEELAKPGQISPVPQVVEAASAEIILQAAVAESPITTLVGIPELAGIEVPEKYGKPEEQPELVGAGIETGSYALLGTPLGPKSKFFLKHPETMATAAVAEYFWGRVMGAGIEKGISKARAGIKALKGTTKVPLAKITEPELLKGGFPEYPRGLPAEEWGKYFRRVSRAKAAEEELGKVSKGMERVWHATTSKWKSPAVTKPGERFIKGTYTAPELSPYFLEVTGETGEETLSLLAKLKSLRPPGWRFIRGKTPKTLAIEAPLEETPKALAGRTGKATFRAGREFFEETPEAAKAYVRTFGAGKREMEAIIPPGKKLIKETGEYYAKYGDEIIDIEKWALAESDEATKIATKSGKGVKTYGKLVEELSERTARKTTPFMPPLTIPRISMPEEGRIKYERGELPEVKRKKLPRKKAPKKIKKGPSSVEEAVERARKVKVPSVGVGHAGRVKPSKGRKRKGTTVSDLISSSLKEAERKGRISLRGGERQPRISRRKGRPRDTLERVSRKLNRITKRGYERAGRIPGVLRELLPMKEKRAGRVSRPSKQVGRLGLPGMPRLPPKKKEKAKPWLSGLGAKSNEVLETSLKSVKHQLKKASELL